MNHFRWQYPDNRTNTSGGRQQSAPDLLRSTRNAAGQSAKTRPSSPENNSGGQREASARQEASCDGSPINMPVNKKEDRDPVNARTDVGVDSDESSKCSPGAFGNIENAENANCHESANCMRDDNGMHNIPQTEGKAAAVGFTGGAGERSGQKDASDRPVRKNGDNSYSGGFADEPSEQALLSGLTGADRSFDPFEKTSLLGGSGFINADDLFAPGRSAGLSGSLSGDRPAAENRPDGAFGMFEDGMALGADPSGGGLTRGGIFENNAAGDSSFEDGMALNGGLAGDREFADPDAGKTDEQVFFDADTLPDGYRPHEEELRSGETELLDGIRQWRQGMDEWRRGMEQWRQGIDEWRGAQPAGSAGGQNLTENAGRTVTVIGSTSSKDPANVGAADDPRMSGGAGTPAMLPDVQYPEMSYAQFLMQNRCSGTLKVQAYAAQQSIPLSGVDIIVSRRFSDGVHVFFTGRTDSSGIIDNISLPAPSRDLSLESGSRMPAAIYDLTARIAGLRPISYTFDIFDSVETIQSIILRSFVR